MRAFEILKEKVYRCCIMQSKNLLCGDFSVTFLFYWKENIYWEWRHCLSGHIIRCLTHKELTDHLDVFFFFLSRCDLVECTISSHNKWTKMMFHLRMCLNQNTLWLQLLPAEWAPFSICMMSRFVCTLWALFVMKYFLISYMSNRLRLIDAVAK